MLIKKKLLQTIATKLYRLPDIILIQRYSLPFINRLYSSVFCEKEFFNFIFLHTKVN